MRAAAQRASVADLCSAHSEISRLCAEIANVFVHKTGKLPDSFNTNQRDQMIAILGGPNVLQNLRSRSEVAVPPLQDAQIGVNQPIQLPNLSEVRAMFVAPEEDEDIEDMGAAGDLGDPQFFDANSAENESTYADDDVNDERVHNRSTLINRILKPTPLKIHR